MKNIFQQSVVDEVIYRINNLKPDTKPLWGKMDVAKMLAHCNVTYEFIYDSIHPVPNGFVKLLLKLFVKKGVVNEVPYKKNLKTAPEFIISNERNFEKEKERLINYIKRTADLGESHFDGKESRSFGKLNITEWNNMFYKHLDHHLSQFGV
jgi:hypothetical protein